MGFVWGRYRQTSVFLGKLQMSAYIDKDGFLSKTLLEEKMKS